MPTVELELDEIEDISGGPKLLRYGPTLYVQIGFDRAFSREATGRPSLPEIQLPALVDTGADECCIDAALADRLSLPVVDEIQFAGAQGMGKAKVHLAQIYVPSLNATVHGPLAGVNLSEGGQFHSALIGRDFLQNFTMFYEGQTGRVIITNDWPHSLSV